MPRNVQVAVSQATRDQILEHFVGADPESAVAQELRSELPGLLPSAALRLARGIWRGYLATARMRKATR